MSRLRDTSWPVHITTSSTSPSSTAHLSQPLSLFNLIPNHPISSLTNTLQTTIKMLPRRLILRSLRPARPTLLTKTTTSFFTTSATLRTDSTDPDSDSRIPPKDELHPRRQEQTFSGSDEEIADDRAAYDPSVTDPREEKRMVGRDVSAARRSRSARDVSCDFFFFFFISSCFGGRWRDDTWMGS